MMMLIMISADMFHNITPAPSALREVLPQETGLQLYKKEVTNDLKIFDFDGNKSLTEAEGVLNDELIRNLVDEIFNKIFSNW